MSKACDSSHIDPAVADDVVDTVNPHYTVEVSHDRKRFQKEAPHRIVPWKPLQHVITKCLSKCDTYSSCTLRLREVTSCAFTTYFLGGGL